MQSLFRPFLKVFVRLFVSDYLRDCCCWEAAYADEWYEAAMAAAAAAAFSSGDVAVEWSGGPSGPPIGTAWRILVPPGPVAAPVGVVV